MALRALGPTTSLSPPGFPENARARKRWKPVVRKIRHSA